MAPDHEVAEGRGLSHEAFASSHLAVVQSTEDSTEAVSALREHREPVFKGH